MVIPASFSLSFFYPSSPSPSFFPSLSYSLSYSLSPSPSPSLSLSPSPRERLLLVDPENSTAITKQLVALVVGHELAHQWFGNLVSFCALSCD